MITNLFLALFLYNVVPNVDFERYAGTWHEVARFPNRFQKRCVGEVTANYTLRTDGKIDVLNRCRVQDGTYISVRGIAKTAGKGLPNSMLKVRFAPKFLSFLPQVWGPYHVIVLAEDYSYACGWIAGSTIPVGAVAHSRIAESEVRTDFGAGKVAGFRYS
jgi:lipocalin